MKEAIRTYINDPKQLEKLYRANKAGFKQEFSNLYPELQGQPIAEYWQERLNYEKEPINWGSRREIIFLILASLVAGLIAKLPFILAIDEAYFYPRNIGFILFPLLTAYFAWKNQLSVSKITFIVVATLLGVLYINFLPNNKQSDTLILSCIHLVLFLWCLLGVAFVGSYKNNYEKRLSFLTFNGDLVVITTLIVISGGILTGITINLFRLIGFHIEDFYFQNIVVFGLPAAPILGTYLTQTNPELVSKISPVIAKIFSPLVLVMLIIYVVAMAFSGKDPYNDREFLLMFNLLLIGVMAIIFFSVSETAKSSRGRLDIWVLLLLSVVTIIVNGIALSAIVFRIAEGGFTPNRAAVLGGNVLILINLVLVMVQLFRVVSKRGTIDGVGNAIARYLPVYFIWTVVVTFLFPFLFGFK